MVLRISSNGSKKFLQKSFKARAKALAVESKRRCITVTEEPEDPGIPDLVRRRRYGLGMVGMNLQRMREHGVKKSSQAGRKVNEEAGLGGEMKRGGGCRCGRRPGGGETKSKVEKDGQVGAST
ncbi:putative helicase [Sesbania bispinosa]|nr:putative helicase [Sesbania bispinosa]